MKNLFYLFFLLSYYGQAQENSLRPEIQACIDSIEMGKVFPMSPNYFYIIKSQERYDILKEMIYPSEVELLKKSTNPQEVEIANRITAYYKVKKIENEIANRNYKPLFKFLRLPYKSTKSENDNLKYSMGDPEYKIRFFKKIQRQDLIRFLKHRDYRVQFFAAIALIEQYKNIKPVLKQFPKFLTDKIIMSFRSGCVSWSEYMSDYLSNRIVRLYPEFKPAIDDIMIRIPNETNYYFNLYAPEEPYVHAFSPNKKQLLFLAKEFQKTQNPMNVYPLILNNPNYNIELLLKAIKKELLKEDVQFSLSTFYNAAARPLTSALYGLAKHNNKERVLNFYSEIHQKILKDNTYRDSISKRKMQVFYEGLTYLNFNSYQFKKQEENNWVINLSKKQQSILEEAAENKLFIKY